MQERFVDVGTAFVADGEPAKSVQPGQGAFHHPPVSAPPLAGLNAAAGEAALDAALSEVSAAKAVIVSLIGREFLRAVARPTVPAFEGRYGLKEGRKDRAVLSMGARDFHRERDALPIDHHMALRARFAAIRRIRAGA